MTTNEAFNVGDHVETVGMSDEDSDTGRVVKIDDGTIWVKSVNGEWPAKSHQLRLIGAK